VRQRSRAIAAEMAQVPGFIGWVGIVIEERLYTLTLWGPLPTPYGSSEQTPSTRPQSDTCTRATSALPGIPESGSLITSIPSGSGV